MAQSAPRLLFALNEPGYFRHYGSAIVELVDRGWDVALVFDRPERRGSGAQLPRGLGNNEHVWSLGALPEDVAPASALLRHGLGYLRYLELPLSEATYLRRRAEVHLPAPLRFLTRIRRVPRWVVSAVMRLGRGVERLTPASAVVSELIRGVNPSAIVVSPVVTLGKGLRQNELVKAGMALGIPVVVGVASWDHLTSKGLIHTVPDAVTVWNETQAEEAVRLHRIPRSRVIVTGAQSFDHWFEQGPVDAVGELRRELGIDSRRRVVLFAGSSVNMAPGDSEPTFVRRWLTALRASRNAELRDAFVIVRPHPGNTAPWRELDLGDAAVVIRPRAYSGMPLSSEEVEAFRAALLVSTAVVGVNTTAMIEAAILRRPVFSIHDPAFAHSQRETLHFGYLTNSTGGFVVAADSLSAHVQQLEDLFSHGPSLGASDRFVSDFVRPHGLDKTATATFCDAIERIAGRASPRQI